MDNTTKTPIKLAEAALMIGVSTQTLRKKHVNEGVKHRTNKLNVFRYTEDGYYYVYTDEVKRFIEMRAGFATGVV